MLSFLIFYLVIGLLYSAYSNFLIYDGGFDLFGMNKWIWFIILTIFWPISVFWWFKNNK